MASRHSVPCHDWSQSFTLCTYTTFSSPDFTLHSLKIFRHNKCISKVRPLAPLAEVHGKRYNKLAWNIQSWITYCRFSRNILICSAFSLNHLVGIMFDKQNNIQDKIPKLKKNICGKVSTRGVVTIWLAPRRSSNYYYALVRLTNRLGWFCYTTQKCVPAG